MADLKKFEAEVRAEHEALTTAFLSAQVTAEAAWTEYEARKKALTVFRRDYLKVIKALDAGAVRVATGRETVTVTASDVGTIKVKGK